MGRLRYRCAVGGVPVGDDAICRCEVDVSNWSSTPEVCPPLLTLPAGPAACGPGEECRRFDANPNHGVTSFDHIGDAAYNVFQSLTLEGWIDITYMLMAGQSLAGAPIYMVGLVVFLAWFVVKCGAARRAGSPDGGTRLPHTPSLGTAASSWR